jgi:hypothetical protein
MNSVYVSPFLPPVAPKVCAAAQPLKNTKWSKEVTPNMASVPSLQSSNFLRQWRERKFAFEVNHE